MSEPTNADYAVEPQARARRIMRWLCRHDAHKIEHVRTVSPHWSEGRCLRCPWTGTYESWPETR
jgi:3-methyladenine DNA glycosylase AlkC